LRVAIKSNTHIALFLLLIGLTMSGTAYSQVPVWEREALIALYNATDGATGALQQGKVDWNGAVGTECDWTGVTCSAGVIAGYLYGPTAATYVRCFSYDANGQIRLNQK